MKTFRLIFFLFSVTAIAAGFYACDGTTDPPAPSMAPTIAFSAPTYTAKDVGNYEDIVFNYTCTYNMNSKAALDSVKCVAKFTPGGTQTLFATKIPSAYSNSYTSQYLYTISATAPLNQVITLTFSVKDEDGMVGSRQFTFTVKDLSDIIIRDLEMGAQSNTTLGSYFAADSNIIYKSTYAKAHASRIDFVYIYDESGNADCIAAPNDPIVSSQTVDLCGAFSVKNATQFKQLPPMTDSAYNKIRTAAEITQKYNGATGTSVGVIKTLTDGSGGTDATFISFKTVNNQYGIAKVTEITMANPGMKNSMKINVRVTKP